MCPGMAFSYLYLPSQKIVLDYGSFLTKQRNILKFQQLYHKVVPLRILRNNFCCSVAQSCLTFCSPMDCSMSGFPVLHYLLEFAQIRVHRVGDAIQPSHPLSSPSFLPSVFPRIRVFSRESALYIRWLKYWSFSFSINPSNRYSGLFSFRRTP